MKQKILHRFRNLSFRNKITTICLAISMIPLLLLGLLGYWQISSQMITASKKNLEETLRQTGDALDYKLSTYMNALELITWDETIKTSIVKKYATNYDLYMFYKESVDSLFLNIRSQNPDIEMISLYTDADINPHTPYVCPLETAEGFHWYEQAVASTVPFFQVSEDGKKLFLLGQMYYKHPTNITVACITINMDALFESVSYLAENSYGFLIMDDAGQPVYEMAAFPENSAYPSVSQEQILQNIMPSSLVSARYTLKESQWSACLYRPLHELRVSLRHFQLIALTIAILCVLVSIMASALLSKIISKPLEQLSLDIKKVEHGNYDIISVPDDRTDEIGQLQYSFQAMVAQLNHMINEVLIAKINQQKYELRMLQAQINPHFLYNSLSLINSQAILSGQTGISEMAQLLSTFYRTMLNKGKSFTTVKQEIENTKAYVSIQQIMHSYSFDVAYDIDERCLNFPVLNLILQPLAENSILHGLDKKLTPGKGILTIFCRLDGNDMLFRISDNGSGMSEEQCQTIITSNSRGYGVKNVHQRIQLYYGANRGLQYRSTPGVGTCVTICLTCNPETDITD